MAEYIEREALLQQLEMAIECKDCPRNADRKTYYDRCACSEIQDICDAITEAPKADVQPVKRGRWEKNNFINWRTCSICGYRIDVIYAKRAKYCPNCGADMQGDENSTQLVDKVYNKSGICVNKNPISLSDDEPIKG